MAVTKITGAGLGLPNADGNALGGASNEWSDLYLADGGIIYLGNDQDINITHVADTGITTSGTFQATTITATTAVVPDASDGAALGTAALEWSDLFLADGAIINFGDDQDITLTHSADAGLTTNGTFQATTITATTAVVPDASDGAALGTTSLEWSDLYLADGAVLGFGDDQDVTLTHVADTGLILKNAHTSGNSGIGAVLTLQTGDTDVADGNILGHIKFQAPNEGAGTDAIVIAAAIAAESEGDFSSTNNATSLVFQTGASEVATTKMTLTSGGNLDVTGDITGSTVNADGDTAAGDNAAIGYTAGEGLILTGQGSTNDITIKNDADADVITIPTGATGVVLAGALTLGDGLEIDVASGDPKIVFDTQGADKFVLGVDDSDSDKFKIDTGGTVGGATVMEISNSDKSVFTQHAIVKINAQTGTTYTTVLTDSNKLITLSNGSSITLTIPPNSSVAYPIGTVIACMNLGAGIVTTAQGSGVTIRSRNGLVAGGQYAVWSLTKFLSDTWILAGDVTT